MVSEPSDGRNPDTRYHVDEREDLTLSARTNTVQLYSHEVLRVIRVTETKPNRGFGGVGSCPLGTFCKMESSRDGQW